MHNAIFNELAFNIDGLACCLKGCCMSQRIYDSAKLIWDYHQLNHSLVQSDCIIALGSNDERVAEHAASLYFNRYAPYIIFSGGEGELTKGLYDTSEAEHFAKIAMDMGVPKGAIFIEENSSNTGENILFSRRLLNENKLNPQRFILVQNLLWSVVP
jgi:uncharacterized SAM-binding protein YcdF (DUF218 family)